MVPLRQALRAGVGLGEDGPEFDLAGAGRAVGLLARATRQFRGHHRHPGAIDFHIQDGDGGRLTAPCSNWLATCGATAVTSR
jgi:hypothetical protein